LGLETFLSAGRSNFRIVFCLCSTRYKVKRFRDIEGRETIGEERIFHRKDEQGSTKRARDYERRLKGGTNLSQEEREA